MSGDGVPIEIRPVMAPDGQLGVLLQLPDGYVVIRADGARRLAGLLEEVAAEIETVDCPTNEDER